MRKILAVAILALAAAGPASAKGVLGVQLCGPSGCQTERGSSAAAVFGEGPGGPFTSDGAAVAPAEPAKWYRGYGLIGDAGRVHGRVPFYYVPAAGMIVQRGTPAQSTTWTKASGSWREALDRLAARLDPYPPPRIIRASVDGRAADDPQSYISLFTIGEKAKTYPKELDSVQVVLESKQRSPWTDGNYLALYPKSRLLVRDGQFASVPAWVAKRAAAGASLAAPDRSFPWTPVAVAVALTAVVAGAVLVARRTSWRRPEAGTA